MDILNLYENASGKLENASKTSFEIENKITSITMILSSKEQLYVGFNSKKINQSLETEDISSEYMALAEFLFAQESAIDTIVTIDSETLLPQNPSDDFINMILNMNIDNKSCKVVTGKNSQVVLSSLNDKIPGLITEIETKLKEKVDEVLKIVDDVEEAKTKEEEKNDGSSMGIDTSGLKMIYDDWESTDVSEEKTNDVQENKPFNANSLSSQNHDTATTEPQPMNNGMYQQQPMNNGMYQQQQPMNNMYQQQPMNGMYQQQPMNNMYQQQPMNGMYQQQPMNNMYQQQPMNGMYQQQPMNNMYQQQPMNGMYQQQPMNNMYQPNGTNSVYLNQMNNQGSPNQNFRQTANSNTSNYLNGLQAPVTPTASPSGTTQQMSVYGSNINAGDNNAIFKDRLNDILGTNSKSSPVEEEPIEDAMQSVMDKKKAAKIDAKFLKKQKKNNNL